MHWESCKRFKKNNMKLNKQQQKIYTYLKEHGEATIIQMRNDLFIAKPCMRISEINLLSQVETGEPLIVTKYKKKNGELVKTLAKQLTREVIKIKLVERDGKTVAVPYKEIVNV